MRTSSMQVLDAVPECGRTEFVVSGAASKTRSLDDPERNQAPFQIGDVYGFFWMEAVEAARARGEPTVPTSIGAERETNIFMRARDADQLAERRAAKDAA